MLSKYPLNVISIILFSLIKESIISWWLVSNANPFSSSTEIKFYLSEEAHVVIAIYNVLGEMVEEITNSNFSEGINTIEFNATSYNSGNYFYKINTDNYSATRSLSINK